MNRFLVALSACTLLWPAPRVSAQAAEDAWIDNTYDWLYSRSHGAVVWVDQRGAGPGQEPQPTPPSRFRIGAYTQIELEPGGKLEVIPVADFDADVNLPNLEDRLRVFVSTLDPTSPPGRDALEGDTTLRVGASRDFLDNWKTSVGIKAKWEPEVFVHTQWAPKILIGDAWQLHPKTRLFWENEERFGGYTALTAGRWKNRWLFRQSLSLKWSQKRRDEDRADALDAEVPGLGIDGKGYRWDATSVFGYAAALLDEREHGRMVGGGDVARGAGLRLSVRGNAELTEGVRFTLFGKTPLYRDYLYGIIAPEVRWEDEDDWSETYVLNIGLEMNLWGERRP